MLRKYREAQNEEGFTLIELLVVVLIIGILAAIAIPVFLDQRQKAYRNAASSDTRNLALVMEDYASDNSGVYSKNVTADLQFNPSEGVEVQAFVNPATDNGYCLLAVHTAFGGSAASTEHWIYDATGGTANASVVHNEAAAPAGCGALAAGDGGGWVAHS